MPQLIENGVGDGDSVSRPVMEFVCEVDQSMTPIRSKGYEIILKMWSKLQT